MTNEPLKATHTPLPWRVRALENFGWNIVHYIDGDKFNLKRIAKVSTEEDANRIVHAVNSHHDLIEALRDVGASLAAAISLLERGGKAAKKAAPSDRMFDQMVKDYKASLNRTRAILTKEAGQ